MITNCLGLFDYDEETLRQGILGNTRINILIPHSYTSIKHACKHGYIHFGIYLLYTSSTYALDYAQSCYFGHMNLFWMANMRAIIEVLEHGE